MSETEAFFIVGMSDLRMEDSILPTSSYKWTTVEITMLKITEKKQFGNNSYISIINNFLPQKEQKNQSYNIDIV